MKLNSTVTQQRFISAFLIITATLFQCKNESEEISPSDYLAKTTNEININGNKIALVTLANGTQVTFWEFEDAMALNVSQPEFLDEIDDSYFAPNPSYSETYQRLAMKADVGVLKAIQMAEKRISERNDFAKNQLQVSILDPEKFKTGNNGNSNGKTALSYGCSSGAAQLGAAHKSYWTKADYDYSDCEVNSNFCTAFGEDLTYIAVGVRVSDNAHITIERWNPSYKVLIDSYAAVKGYHYKWYITYTASNPVDYIQAYSSSDSGVECPKVHVCLAGNY